MAVPKLDRRILLGGLACTPLLTVAAAVAERRLPATPASSAATDAGYWDAARRLYKVSDSLINLENGYWGIMAEPVKDEFKRLTDVVNSDNTIWARSKAGADLEAVRIAVAGALGCNKDEIALTRGASEALQVLISGYNKLKPGDTVMFADLDYDAMQYAMSWLKDRRGVNVVRFPIPEPATRANVLAAYDEQLKANPATKLLLLTHISHRTGLMMPVREISDMARARGADVIVDAAHSWGQVDLKAPDLGADFVGFNLHKWIGAPLGCGCFYIKGGRLADIDRQYGDEDSPATDIRSRVHTGTINFAAWLAIPTALALHEEMGPGAKEARFRHLRDRWVNQARGIDGVEVLTPDDPTMSAGITSFRLKGRVDAAANNALVASLRDKHRIMTVRRGGIANGHAIRITPAPYTSEADMDALVAALKVVAQG